MPPWCPRRCHVGVNEFGDAQEPSRRLYWGGGGRRPTGRARRTAMRRIRMALVPGVLLALALGVAACGGGGKASGVASLKGGDKATATNRAGAGSDRQGGRGPGPGAA